MTAPPDPAPDPRHLQMLEELAELGMELAREVQMLAKSRLVEARVSGWDGNLPKDPAAPFVKIAQAVRRTLALKVALKEGLVPAPFPVAEARTPNPSPDRPLRDAAEPTDRAERPLSLRALIAEDLRGDLDDRERLLDFPTERGRPRPPFIADFSPEIAEPGEEETLGGPIAPAPELLLPDVGPPISRPRANGAKLE